MKIKILSVLIFVLTQSLVAQEIDSMVTLEVNFQLDSHFLSKSEKRRIDSLLEVAPPEILNRLEIYGHTDSLAGLEYNKQLSKRRVQSILTYLVYRGIDPLSVKTDHYGEENPKYDNGPDERHKNRRVELSLIIDPSLVPPPEQKLTDLEFKEGDKIRIPKLNFVGNQPIPVWQSYPSLSELLMVMQQYPQLKIELQGHVCCGDDYELSVERAKVVYYFLKANGISPNRMAYKGFSNSKPLFRERTERDKAMNRRVEVYVVSNPGEKLEVKPEKDIIDIQTPVLNIKFFPSKGRLMPSGDFMLELIAEMMRESEGLYYDFKVFDNINNSGLTSQRVSMLKRKLQQLKVERTKFTVRKMENRNNLPSSDNDNFILLKISQR